MRCEFDLIVKTLVFHENSMNCTLQCINVMYDAFAVSKIQYFCIRIECKFNFRAWIIWKPKLMFLISVYSCITKIFDFQLNKCHKYHSRERKSFSLTIHKATKIWRVNSIYNSKKLGYFTCTTVKNAAITRLLIC